MHCNAHDFGPMGLEGVVDESPDRIGQRCARRFKAPRLAQGEYEPSEVAFADGRHW
jgi:hypothetical protein